MDATTGEVAGASVQIGDPIVEKLLIDVLRRRRATCYTAITDCGAGGLSSAVGEMAEGVGADVDLDARPAQVPRPRAVGDLALRGAGAHGVAVPPGIAAPSSPTAASATASRWPTSATFTGDGVLTRAQRRRRAVLELDTDFLHDGRPQRQMTADAAARRDRNECRSRRARRSGGALLALLVAPEHRLEGGDRSTATTTRSSAPPSCGRSSAPAHDGPADGVVLAEPTDTAGIAIGIGVNPWYGLARPRGDGVRGRRRGDPQRRRRRRRPRPGRAPRQLLVGRPASSEHARRTGRRRRRMLRGGDGLPAHRSCRGKDSLNNEYTRRRRRTPRRAADARDHRRRPRARRRSRASPPTWASRATRSSCSAPRSAEFAGSHLDLVLGEPRRRRHACRRPTPTLPSVTDTSTRRCTPGCVRCVPRPQRGRPRRRARRDVHRRPARRRRSRLLPHDDARDRAVRESHRTPRRRGRTRPISSAFGR